MSDILRDEKLRLRLTSIVLLLLMVIAKLALTLRSHSALGLHHLLRLVGPALEALGGVEVLKVRGRVGAGGIEFAD